MNDSAAASQAHTDIKPPLSKSRHFATLDGLRGTAAFAILFHHICQSVYKEDLLIHAHLAVDFFFMLSGFVVAKAYEAKLRNASLPFVEFVKIRWVRLYPMIFVGVVMGALVLGARMVTTHDLTADQLLVASLSALFLFPTTALFSVHPGLLYPVDSPQWSLFFELAINFMYAPLVRWLTTRKLVIISVLSGIALLAIAISNQGLHIGFWPQTFMPGFVRIIFPFSLGILLFRYRPTYRLNWIVGLLLALCLIVILLMPFFKDSGVYEFIAVAVFFPPIVFFGSICENGPVLNRICMWLGELSYPLYITHSPLLRLASNAVTAFHLHAAPVALIGMWTVVSVVAANLLLVLWDRPVRKRLTVLLLQKRQSA